MLRYYKKLKKVTTPKLEVFFIGSNEHYKMINTDKN